MDKELINIRKVNEKDALEWFTLKNKVWRDAYKDIFQKKYLLRMIIR